MALRKIIKLEKLRVEFPSKKEAIEDALRQLRAAMERGEWDLTLLPSNREGISVIAGYVRIGKPD